MKPDTRFNPAPEIRAETNPDGTITFRGYAAVFNRESKDLGGFKELIAPSAFDRCLANGNADVRCLQNHESSRVLGRTTAKSLRVWVDSKGLAFETRSQPTSYARDLSLNVAAREVTGCSFRFYCAEGGDSWAALPDGAVIRTLKDIEIDEITIATFPAYRETEVSTRSAERRDEFHRGQTSPPPAVPIDFEGDHRRRLAQIAAIPV